MQVEDFRDISYDKDSLGIVTLTFNTPARKNALSGLSFLEIYWALEHFETDETAYAMIITRARDPNSGDPKKEAYSSGGYFSPDAYDGIAKEVMAQIDNSDIARKKTTLKVFQCDKPILAAVNGLAIGGAFTFTLAAADQVFLSEHAWVQLPFAKLGIAAELASTVLLPQLLGLQKTKQILFYPERISAEQAVELGLANEVPHASLMAHVREKALQLIPPRGAGMAIREMKRSCSQPLEHDDMAYQYETISTRLKGGVLTATLSHPPINVMTVELFTDLVAFTAEVAADEAARVVVLESADPDFFIAHFDVELILTFPIDKPAQKAETLNDFHLMCERVRTMPKPTIARIAGRVGGGGTQYLPRLMGRGRAMEVILGGVDMDADLAEHWGYLNRAFDDAAALDDHVDTLAKRSVLNAELPLEEGLLEEAFLFQQTLRYPEATANMTRALALGAQTRKGELNIVELGEAVNSPGSD